MGVYVPIDFASVSKVNDYENLHWLYQSYKYLASFTFVGTLQTGDYTASLDDHVIQMDLAAPATVTLPDPTTCVGKIYVIVAANDSGNDVTVECTNGQVQGAASVTITVGTVFNTAVRYMSLGRLGYWQVGTFTGADA